ncbi:MAG: hypothetical protein AAGD40_06175 [Pseudomonadota bacterium]
MALFATAQRTVWLQDVLSSRALLFFGFTSYPLYLLHNELGIGLISYIGSFGVEFINPFLPLLVGVIVTALAYLVAKEVEPALQRILRPSTVRELAS